MTQRQKKQMRERLNEVYAGPMSRAERILLRRIKAKLYRAMREQSKRG